jgi:hypothetical protein
VNGSRGRTVTFTAGAGSNFVQERNEYGEAVGEVNRIEDKQRYEYNKEEFR